MNNLTDQTLSAIVLEHHELVPVLEKYNLDFCCRGKRPLGEACAEKNISLETILPELEAAMSPSPAGMDFSAMTPDQLIGYIVLRHHFYVRQALPVIEAHVAKVVTKHGGRYPYMQKVQALFTEVQQELIPHLYKEENILFPRIKEIAAAAGRTGIPAGYIHAPIAVMEHEHDHAGQLMFAIREITGNYTPPADACTTHRVCLEELKAFENDLHQHVHLENNILFPKAALLMQAEATEA
ncbi:MAG: iron-sulfur cluster repair di-iron protein [Ferruginibacter sp.]